jgi:hypothetical protein
MAPLRMTVAGGLLTLGEETTFKFLSTSTFCLVLEIWVSSFKSNMHFQLFPVLFLLGLPVHKGKILRRRITVTSSF